MIKSVYFNYFHFNLLHNLYLLKDKKDKICMRIYLVRIKDVRAVKFILLSVLIFFGTIARRAADGVASKDKFLIAQLNSTINIQDSNPAVKILP